MMKIKCWGCWGQVLNNSIISKTERFLKHIFRRIYESKIYKTHELSGYSKYLFTLSLIMEIFFFFILLSSFVHFNLIKLISCGLSIKNYWDFWHFIFSLILKLLEVTLPSKWNHCEFVNFLIAYYCVTCYNYFIQHFTDLRCHRFECQMSTSDKRHRWSRLR